MESKRKLALVTGAAVRLGRVVSEVLAGEGMRVALHYHRHQTEAAELASRLNDLRPASDPPVAACFRADLRHPTEAAALIETVEAAMGPLDLVVLSAAIYPREALAEITPESLEETLRVNLTSPFLLAKEAGLRMQARSRGQIIILLDWSLDRPYPDRLPYTLAKAGLRAAVPGLARALAPHVRVNGIALGAVLLPEGTTPAAAERVRRAALLDRAGQPHDLARAVLYLANADFVTGEILTVDGGRSVA